MDNRYPLSLFDGYSGHCIAQFVLQSNNMLLLSFINSARLSRLIALGVFKFALNNVAFISLFFLIILLKDSYRNTGLVHLEVDLYQDDNG
jgi:hypothetical protein